jgi:hypothetical protein
MGKWVVRNTGMNVYTFSHSKLDIFVGKYLNLIVIIGWIIILVLETFWGAINFSNFRIRYPNISINLLLPFFFVLGLLFYLSLIKFAYQVAFDFSNETVTFLIYNKKNPVSYKLNELKAVRINWFIFFVFQNGETIWYKSDSAFIRFLKEFDINREWGGIGKYFMKREFELDRQGKQGRSIN